MPSDVYRVLALTGAIPAFQTLADAVGAGGLQVVAELEGGVGGGESEAWDLVVVDSAFAGGGGDAVAIDLARAGMKVILVARTPSFEGTAKALRGGVVDVVGFPPDPGRILAHLSRGTDSRESLPLQVLGDENALVGADERMIEIFRLVARAAGTSENVLILGEVGSGKATLARLLHRHSDRADRDLVELSVSALSEGLLESELLGHEVGTFPWAIARRMGRLERAHESTLFLDEIHLLPPRLQLALLNVLTERRVQHVGGDDSIPADVRLVAASTQDLGAWVDEGRFLEDLYYRIASVSVTVPPLRDRGEDMVLLARHFGAMAARRYERDVTRVSADAVDKLKRHEWPGNARELKQVMDRAVLVADGPTVEARHLPEGLQWPSRLDREALGLEEGAAASLDEMEAAHIRRVVRSTAGNLSQAAEILEIHRNTLRRKLDKYKIPT